MSNTDSKPGIELIDSPDVQVVRAILRELRNARRVHASIHSPHEGYAVIAEELDEAWAEVLAANPGAMATELIQTAAMCVRTIVDLDLTWRAQGHLA